jgi:hypothetical protein
MADVKISALPDASTSLSDDDYVPVVDNATGVTKKATVVQIGQQGFAASNDPQTRYASLQGNDSSNGWSQSTPKRTIRAALESLPTQTQSGYTYHYGTVVMGRGVFRETVGSQYTTHVLDTSYNLRLIGGGQGPGDRGTRITLENGQNRPLIDGNPAIGSDAHGCEFRDFGLDGNKSNQLTSTGNNADLFICRGGGFGYYIRNVAWSNAKRWALHLDRNACNVHIDEPNFSLCGDSTLGGAFWLTLKGDPSQLTWIGGQIDRCGVECIRVDQYDAI